MAYGRRRYTKRSYRRGYKPRSTRYRRVRRYVPKRTIMRKPRRRTLSKAQAVSIVQSRQRTADNTAVMFNRLIEAIAQQPSPIPSSDPAPPSHEQDPVNWDTDTKTFLTNEELGQE